MTWASIIAALWATFGPLITQWIQNWIDSLLHKSAAKLPEPNTYASPAEAHAALFSQAIDDCPRFALARKALLRRMKAVGSKALTMDDIEEIRGISAACENE